jgi:hypothetical protein
MSPETNDRSAQEIEDDMADEASRLEQRVEQLDERADEAAKKAEVTRAHTEPDTDEPLGNVAGDWTNKARTDNDPTGAIDDPDEDEG